ncbi:MAG: sulfatase-like hydrolase/transferase [Mycobacterium sp.]
MLDDVGFGAASTFGGPVPTPALDRVAGAGLRYNQFHTTALCSPTRAALLTGRNHHSAHMGTICEIAYGGGAAQPVPPRHRHRAHDPRGRRHRAARARQRRRAEADRGCQHAVFVRRRCRGKPANHAVLRDLRQSRCVSPGLDCLVFSWPTALDPHPARCPIRRGRTLGALPPRRRLQPGRRPCRAISRQAGRVEGRIRRGSAQIQRLPAQRRDTGPRAARQPSQPARRSHLGHLLRRARAHPRTGDAGLHQHVVRAPGAAADSAGRRERGGDLHRRGDGRVEFVSARRDSPVCLQLSGA